jgi:hypothetical protein
MKKLIDFETLCKNCESNYWYDNVCQAEKDTCPLWNSLPDAVEKPIACSDRLPELSDRSVLVYFSDTDSWETVHVEDYFADITAGFDEEGNQLYTKWYISQKITHWMELPPKPYKKENG